MRTPKRINQLDLEATCVGVSQDEWNDLMTGATRADKKVINKHVKDYYPDLYDDLYLKRNPYKYFKTKDHLILVHSMIEYFFRYN